MTKTQIRFDAIIIGGSFAGLSAAMALGRSLRRVLIVDNNRPCNQYTPRSHNFITHDGADPRKIAENALAQVLQYRSVRYSRDTVVNVKKNHDGFQISTQSQTTYEAKKLLFATGLKDLLPNIIGFESCWGKSVIHCPYCHGFEFKEKKTAILAQGDASIHLAGLVRNLTDDLTLINPGKVPFSYEQRQILDRNNIQIREEQVTEIIHRNGRMNAIRYGGGQTEPFEIAYAEVAFEQHSPIPLSLGCTLTESGHLQVDQSQQTNIPGIFAAGDCAGRFRSIANAVSSGNIAGAMLNLQLVQEMF